MRWWRKGWWLWWNWFLMTWRCCQGWESCRGERTWKRWRVLWKKRHSSTWGGHSRYITFYLDCLDVFVFSLFLQSFLKITSILLNSWYCKLSFRHPPPPPLNANFLFKLNITNNKILNLCYFSFVPSRKSFILFILVCFLAYRFKPRLRLRFLSSNKR